VLEGHGLEAGGRAVGPRLAQALGGLQALQRTVRGKVAGVIGQSRGRPGRVLRVALKFGARGRFEVLARLGLGLIILKRARRRAGAARRRKANQEKER